MDLDAFRATLASDTAPPGLSPPLAALWHAAKGDWDKAHDLVQSEEDHAAAWVHAYLHRVEGDQSNAAYWYRRADRPVANGPLANEWTGIAGALLTEQ